jgi:hypothetical protein
MRHLKRILSLAVLISAIGAPSCCMRVRADDLLAVSKYVFAITRSSEVNGKKVLHTSTETVYRAADGRTKTEEADASGKSLTITIYLPNDRVSILLDNKKKEYAEQPAPNSRSVMLLVPGLKATSNPSTPLPPRHIAGLKCTGYSSGKGDIYDEVWRCQDPIEVGVVIHREGGSASEQKLTSITRDMPVATDFFSPPPEFRRSSDQPATQP